jgi:protein SCO1/2
VERLTRWLAFLAVLLVQPASAALTPAQLADVGATPPAGAALPVGSSFIDQSGRPYRLSLGATPTVLLFADFSCRHICGPGVTLTAGALHDAGLKPGVDYRMIVIGMDQDGPLLARRLAAERLKGLPAEAAGVKLLTGTPATVAGAEQALGYHAVYDAAADQFAHDAAIYVFSPGGRLSSLLPETASTAAQLKAAVVGARQDVAFIPTAPKSDTGFIGRVSAICYGLTSAHGVYAGPIVLGLRIGGILICLGLGLFVFGSLRRHRRAQDAT